MTPGRVARRRRPFRIEDRLQRCKLLDGRVATDALVGVEIADGDDLLGEDPGILRRRGARLRARRPRVLRLAGDLELARDARRLDDHVVAVERRREPVEHHVVDHLAVAEPVAEARLRQQVRRVRHRLHAARHDDVVPAGADHQIGQLDRPDRGGADLVDRVGGDFLRDPRANGRLPCGRLADAGLEHLAHDDVADLGGIDACALEPCPDRDRAELRRRVAGETAAEPAERRSHRRDDHRARHGASVPPA